MTTFHLVTNRARKLDIIDAADAVAEFAKRGFQMTGHQMATHLRPELRGKAKFEGLCGPMWGGTDDNGDPIIRYEDWDTYNILSR